VRTPDESGPGDTVPDVDKAQKRGWRGRIVERWTPLFPEETEVTALTAEEFAEACDWPALRAAGIVAEHEHPLELAGLQLSAIFPRHLLRVRDDGRLVPISCEDAVALVRIALAQERRGAGVGATAVSVHETAPVTNGSGAVDDDAGDHDSGDEPVNGARRRFPFRRRD
jgi:hypothetical protein